MKDEELETIEILPENSSDFPSKTEHPCKGCLHYYGRYHNNKCCNYLFDMGHMRPCKPGKDCTVKRLIGSDEDLKLRNRIDEEYLLK